jgi:hypothetical protein
MNGTLQDFSDSVKQIEHSHIFAEQSLLLSKKWFVDRRLNDFIELIVLVAKTQYYSHYFPQKIILAEDNEIVESQWAKIASQHKSLEFVTALNQHFTDAINKLNAYYIENVPFSIEHEEDNDIENMSELWWGALAIRLLMDDYGFEYKDINDGINTLSNIFWSELRKRDCNKKQWIPIELSSDPAQMWWCHYSKVDFTKSCPRFSDFAGKPLPPTSENMNEIGCYKY